LYTEKSGFGNFLMPMVVMMNLLLQKKKQRKRKKQLQAFADFPVMMMSRNSQTIVPCQAGS